MNKWKEFWKVRPQTVHELIFAGNDWLMNVKAEGDELQEKLEAIEKYNGELKKCNPHSYRLVGHIIKELDKLLQSSGETTNE